MGEQANRQFIEDGEELLLGGRDWLAKPLQDRGILSNERGFLRSSEVVCLKVELAIDRVKAASLRELHQRVERVYNTFGILAFHDVRWVEQGLVAQFITT